MTDNGEIDQVLTCFRRDHSYIGVTVKKTLSTIACHCDDLLCYCWPVHHKHVPLFQDFCSPK